MATLQRAIADRLSADSALTGAQPTGLGFTVFDRWLIPSGPGATPGAFDATQGNRLKRSIVVLDGGEVAHAGQPRPGHDGRRWDSYPQTYLFAEAHANGKAAAHAAARRIEALLIGWEVTIDGGQRVAFIDVELRALEDSDQWPGNIVLMARWRAVGSRRLVPA